MVATKTLTMNLHNIGRNDFSKIGGKAANLGELIQNDFLVPEGFVVTTEAYSIFLKHNNLNELIQTYI